MPKMNGKETNKGQGFDANPQNINRKGRPKKGISLVNEEMKKKGYEPASRSEIEETYLMLFQLTQKHLESYAKNSTKPMLVRIVAKAILSRKGFDVIERMLDRGVGKPSQSLVGTDGGPIEIKTDAVIKLETLLSDNA